MGSELSSSETKLGRFLCRIGLHKAIIAAEIPALIEKLGFYQAHRHQVCLRCGKVRWFQ